MRQQWRLERIENERRLQEARRLSQNGRESEAAAVFTELLRANPSDLEALRSRALSYNVLWKAEKEAERRLELEKLALADISRAVELQPEAAWPYHVRAFILRELGRDTEAEADEKAAKRNASVQPTASDLIIDGLLALQERDNAGAIRLFSEVIRLKPDSTDAHLYRSKAYERLCDSAKAIKDLEISAALQPGDAYPRHWLGRLLTESGSLQEGEAQLREALDRRSDDAEIHRAEESARKALALDPNLPWAHVNLGASLMELNRLLPVPDPALIQEAVGEFEKVISQPEASGDKARSAAHASALVNQCDALIQAGDYRRALKVCTVVEQREPGDPDNHYNLAGVYAQLGRPNEALASLKKDFELGDTDYQYLASDKWFASLHDDPRFKALLEEMRKAAAK